MNPVHALQNYRASVIELPALFRALVAHPDWYIPVDAEDRPYLWSVSGADCIAAMAEPAMPDGTVPAKWLPMRGRHLVRHLDPAWVAIAFEAGHPWSRAFGCEKYGDHWVDLAGALDVEDALEHPAPGQIDLLLDHEWIVLCRDGVPCVDLTRYDTRAVHLFTAVDRLMDFGGTQDCAMMRAAPAFEEHRAQRMNGRELFAQLAERHDYDGLIVNIEEWSYWPNPRQFLGPRFAAGLLAGADARAGAEILRARSMAEIALFLDLARAPSRTHRAATLEGRPVLHYDAEVDRRHVVDWYFHPVVEALDDPEALGDGTTEILCPGMLAAALSRELTWSDPEERTDWESRTLPRLVRWADELLKLLPEGADHIPRERLRTMEGARLWRVRPELRTRSWLEETRQKAAAIAADA